jgi:hypothetical protein
MFVTTSVSRRTCAPADIPFASISSNTHLLLLFCWPSACCQHCLLHSCSYLSSDAAVLAINALANATMLLRLRMLADLPLGSRAGLLLNLMLSIAHAALVRSAPEPYKRWRTFLVSCARLLRMTVVLSLCGMPGSGAAQSSGWVGTALQLLLLSPASASLLCAVALPLPLRSHVALQVVLTGLALSRAPALCDRVPHTDGSARCGALQLLSERLRWMNPFATRVLPWVPADGPGCCVPALSAVMLAHGIVFSSVAVYTIDLVSRTNFLRREAGLPPGSVAALVRVMRAVWLVGCVTALSCLPVVWELCLLAQKLGEVGLAGYGFTGVAALLTSLLLESFMRVWLALVLLLLSSVFFVLLGE